LGNLHECTFEESLLRRVSKFRRTIVYCLLNDDTLLLYSHKQNQQQRQVKEFLTMASPVNTNPEDVKAAFERPLNEIYDSLYDDDVAFMVNELPVLASKCKQLSSTEKGRNYVDLRMPAFVLGSNKLEGTTSPGVSEGETFRVLVELMKSGEFPIQPGAHRIPWEEEGNNSDNSAWYEQCEVHVSAIKMILTWAENGEPLTPEKLLQCHSVLMQGAVTSTGEGFQSRFRSFDEPAMAGTYVFPNKVDHEKKIREALEKHEAEFATSHPAAWASKLLREILTNHPFMNGNGCLARLCFAYALVRSGVPCAIVLSDWHTKARIHYIRAVQDAQGQKGPTKYQKLHCMAIVGIYATLKNMLNFCEAKL